jgi:hypothetical protein
MKARAVAVTKRSHKAAGQPLDALNDEQVWAFTRER